MARLWLWPIKAITVLLDYTLTFGYVAIKPTWVRLFVFRKFEFEDDWKSSSHPNCGMFDKTRVGLVVQVHVEERLILWCTMLLWLWCWRNVICRSCWTSRNSTAPGSYMTLCFPSVGRITTTFWTSSLQRNVVAETRTHNTLHTLIGSIDNWLIECHDKTGQPSLWFWDL